MSIRTKHVVSSDMVAHLWVHQTQSDARTPGTSGLMYFEGDTIYSYGSHFPIARHVTNKRGEKAILFTTATYSVTTRGHCCCVESAIRGCGVPVFHVDHATEGMAARTEYASRFTAYLTEAAKSRKHTADFLRQARAIAMEAEAFCKFFGYKFPVSKFTEPTDLKAHFAEQTRKQRAAEARATAKRNAYEAACVADAVAYLPAWRRGQSSIAVNDKRPNPDVQRLSFACFRSINKGAEIETTLGATFPAAHGKRAYRTLLPIRQAGGTYQADGHTIHVGAFQIDSMDAAGVIRAGCHTVEWSEVERLAGEMGWTP